MSEKAHKCIIVCSKCNISKSLDQFYTRKDSKKIIRSWCKSCHNLRQKNWYEDNREKHLDRGREWYQANKGKKRNSHLIRTYGITLEDFNVMKIYQNDLCIVCNKELGNHKIIVDHCHKTGVVRGIIHNGCNLKIGYYELFHDNPELVEKIKKYLDKVTI
jgi:hypothetical protein